MALPIRHIRNGISTSSGGIRFRAGFSTTSHCPIMAVSAAATRVGSVHIHNFQRNCRLTSQCVNACVLKWDKLTTPVAPERLSFVRWYANAKRKEERFEVTESSEKSFKELSTTQKVKRASKDATYTGIVLLGIGVTGVMFYAIGRELFSSQSPSGIYSAAFKRCKQNTEVCDLVGLPMKGYGEMTRRGRRRHVSHNEYERDGMKFLRMKFYIEGPMSKGTVHLEMKKGDSSSWEYRYLFVEIDGFPRRTVIIEDSR